MAKRFYDTGLVDQEWYMSLSAKHKALYMHLLCKCDIAGVFEANYRMMSFYVGETITEDDVFGAFGNRVIPLANSESKGIMVDFVCFQCGGCINPKVKAHKSILKRLKELNIPVEGLISWCNHDLKVADAEAESAEGAGVAVIPEPQIQDPAEAKKKAHKKQCVYVKPKVDTLFSKFWAAYPRKDAKKAAELKFMTVMKECRDADEMDVITGKMIEAVECMKNTEQWTKEEGKFIPMPSTWLNQRRWEDEGVTTSKEAIKEKASSAASEIAKMVSLF